MVPLSEQAAQRLLSVWQAFRPAGQCKHNDQRLSHSMALIA